MSLRAWRDRSGPGFTLLEVLVAMTIVGLGVVTLLEVLSSGLRLGARSSVRTEAAAYGAQVMNELLSRRSLRDGSDGGRAQTGKHWTVQVQPLKIDGETLGLASKWELKEIAVEAFVSDSGRERRVELKTLRLVPRDQ
jgi:prepilin-type N-terminal cleavage/methylation domain-containing protein